LSKIEEERSANGKRMDREADQALDQWRNGLSQGKNRHVEHALNPKTKRRNRPKPKRRWDTGSYGAASPVRRIDPATGKIIED
jgi:hypothetical protein